MAAHRIIVSRCDGVRLEKLLAVNRCWSVMWVQQTLKRLNNMHIKGLLINPLETFDAANGLPDTSHSQLP
jgi:sugar diacid utilization regulator